MPDDDLDDRERRMRERQDGDYEPPILAEPVGGLIPTYRPFDGPEDDSEDDTDPE